MFAGAVFALCVFVLVCWFDCLFVCLFRLSAFVGMLCLYHCVCLSFVCFFVCLFVCLVGWLFVSVFFFIFSVVSIRWTRASDDFAVAFLPDFLDS